MRAVRWLVAFIDSRVRGREQCRAGMVYQIEQPSDERQVGHYGRASKLIMATAERAARRLPRALEQRNMLGIYKCHC